MSGWERVVREHGPMVYQTAWRLLRDAQEAEDVCQEVLLDLVRARQPDPGGGLLRCMAVRRSLDRLRRRRRTLPLLELPHPGASADAALLEAELGDRLREGIATLPPRQAEVFCLRFLHDASYEQIADALHISIQSVGTHLHQARGRLCAFLGELAEEANR